ncbi:hypothetical protein B5F44_09685 [Gordonibacter urolithinfaciens]|nr:hypothetical protein B5F44_09685 [Gordonibacter urolithinfaciens]
MSDINLEKKAVIYVIVFAFLGIRPQFIDKILIWNVFRNQLRITVDLDAKQLFYAFVSKPLYFFDR